MSGDPSGGGALAAAAAHYAARVATARTAADGGRRVIGVVGADVPPELVTAAGAVPLRLHSRPGEPSEEAVRLLGAAIDPVAHSILTQVLAGELDFLGGILFSRDCQASLQLFYVLRQLAPRRPSLPPVHLVDLLHLPRESTARYNRAQVRRCAEVLGAWTGTTPAGPALRSAVARHRDLRAALREAQALRRRGLLTGRQALHLFAAGTSMPVDDAVALVRAALAEVGAGTAEMGGASAPGVRLYFTGSAQDDDAVYAAIEGLDARIVGEDHDWGDLQLTVDADPDAAPDPASGTADDALLAELARAYQRRGPAAPTAPLHERAAFAAAQVREAGAEAVLCITRASDDAPAWDYAVLRELLAADGIPAELLARQPLRPDPSELRAVVVRLMGDQSAAATDSGAESALSHPTPTDRVSAP